MEINLIQIPRILVLLPPIPVCIQLQRIVTDNLAIAEPFQSSPLVPAPAGRHDHEIPDECLCGDVLINLIE
jgi:hypothetical protein